MRKIKNIYFFTARISKKFKKAKIYKSYVDDFNRTFKYTNPKKKHKILLAKKISFNNHFRHPDEIKKMINKLKSLKQIKIINTSSLFYTYKKFFLRG